MESLRNIAKRHPKTTAVTAVALVGGLLIAGRNAPQNTEPQTAQPKPTASSEPTGSRTLTERIRVGLGTCVQGTKYDLGRAGQPPHLTGEASHAIIVPKDEDATPVAVALGTNGTVVAYDAPSQEILNGPPYNCALGRAAINNATPHP